MTLTDWRSNNLLWEPNSGTKNQKTRRLLQAVAAFTIHPSAGTVWRGHSSHHYRLTPSGARGRSPTDPACTQAELGHRTQELLRSAGEASRFWRDGLAFRQLNPLERLAHLQHHAGGTALLDLTPDPMIALWMACQPSGVTTGLYPNHGLLIGFNVDGRWVDLTEATEDYDLTLQQLTNDEQVGWLIPPVVNDRIVVQRSRFLVSRLESVGRWHVNISDVWFPDLPPTWPSGTDADRNKRLENVFEPGKGRPTHLPAVAFLIPGALKDHLVNILQRHYGIARNTVFPDAFGGVRGS